MLVVLLLVPVNYSLLTRADAVDRLPASGAERAPG
jgi:hypothetical protein